MLEKNLASIVLPMLSTGENRGRTFRVSWIHEVDTDAPDWPLRVLFRDVETGRPLIESAHGEVLKHCPIGSLFRDGQRLAGAPPLGEIIEISVESTELNLRRCWRTFGAAVNDVEYAAMSKLFGKGTNDKHDRANKNQLCLSFAQGARTVIFPCTVIGAFYYFTTSSMREQVFAGNLDGLFERNHTKYDPATDSGTILLKPNANNDDAWDIFRLWQNPHALSRWKYIRNSIRGKRRAEEMRGREYARVPLLADFPVTGAISFEVRAITIRDPGSRIEKIVVLEILSEDSPYGCRILKLLRRKYTPSREIEPVDRFEMLPGRRARMVTNTLRTQTPHTGVERTAIVDKRPSDPRRGLEGKELVRDYIPGEPQEYGRKATGDVETVDLSAAKAAPYGNPDVAPAVITTRTKSSRGSGEEDQPFTIEDFSWLMEVLRTQKGVFDYGTGEGGMPAGSGRKRSSCPLIVAYDGNPETPRRFAYATFRYRDRSVCLVEIDHEGLSNGPSVFVLLAGAGRVFDEEDRRILLKEFVARNTYTEIEKFLREARGIGFSWKVHPVGREASHFERWCRTLLSRISPTPTPDPSDTDPEAPRSGEFPAPSRNQGAFVRLKAQ